MPFRRAWKETAAMGRRARSQRWRGSRGGGGQEPSKVHRLEDRAKESAAMPEEEEELR